MLSPHRTIVPLLGALCLALPSCGLVPVPIPRTVPGVVREVRVCDAHTRKPLAGAIVGIEAKRIDGAWLKGSPSILVLGTFPWPDLNFGAPVRVTRIAEGHWRPSQVMRTSIVRPWGIGPLGMALHDEQQVRISARADGYKNLLLFYSPSLCQRPADFRQRIAGCPNAALVDMDEAGLLTIHLPAR